MSDYVKKETNKYLIIGIVIAILCAKIIGAAIIILDLVKYKRYLTINDTENAKKIMNIMNVLIIVAVVLTVLSFLLKIIYYIIKVSNAI